MSIKIFLPPPKEKRAFGKWAKYLNYALLIDNVFSRP